MTDVTRLHPGAPASGRFFHRRRVLTLTGVAAMAATVAACSSMSSLTGGSQPAATASAPAASGGSFTSRVTSFFTGGSSHLSPPAATATGPAAGDKIEDNCPSVDYRQGAATWAVNGPPGENAALSLKYQASFIQTARECSLRNGNLTVKVGVQGRVVVGPAGGPGTLNVPLRYALVREGLEPKTLWTKLYMVPVNVDPSQGNLTWVHVEEDMTVPRPSDAEMDALVIYVGFDPEGATSVKPARPARRKTAQAH